MSETNSQRITPVYDAAVALEADPNSVPKRTALFAAVQAAKARRFYAFQNRLFVVANGIERPLAEFRNDDVLQVVTARLNFDLDNGWNPQFGAQ